MRDDACHPAEKRSSAGKSGGTVPGQEIVDAIHRVIGVCVSTWHSLPGLWRQTQNLGRGRVRAAGVCAGEFPRHPSCMAQAGVKGCTEYARRAADEQAPIGYWTRSPCGPHGSQLQSISDQSTGTLPMP